MSNNTTSATTNIGPSNNRKVRISRPTELFLLFWVDEIEPTVDTTWNPTGHLTGRDLFKEAAQTRLINLKTEPWFDSRFHRAHCPPINHFSEIQKIIDNWIKKYGGSNKVVIREVSFFSHGAWDGPIIYNASQYDPEHMFFDDFRAQIKHALWGDINFYWAGNKECRLNFFGCNTGNVEKGTSKIFARKISINLNNSNVTVSGQMTSSFPSFYPDSRYTTGARSMNKGWNAGPTYMVSGDGGKGKAALIDKVKANKMSFYQGGKNISKSYQSIFNDHRKKRTTNASSELNTIERWLRLYR